MNKVLGLTDIKDLQTDESVEYIAPTSENLLKSVSDMQHHFDAIRNNCVEFNRMIDIGYSQAVITISWNISATLKIVMLRF